MGKRILRRTALGALAIIIAIPACGRHARVVAPEDHRVARGESTLPIDPAIRAGYFYSYVSPFHLDSLANTGFNRAIIKFIGDSLAPRGTEELRGWIERAARLPVEVTPAWSLQSTARLAALRTPRRYTWGSGSIENGVGCPLDSLFWRSALLDRAREILAATPTVRRLALDLEIYTGRPHHYVDPCVCAACIDEQERTGGSASASPVTPEPNAIGARTQRARSIAIARFEEARVTDILANLLAELARDRPGIELGVFDLDRDSFVHRAMARALARSGVGTVDYTERTYSVGSSSAAEARDALQALGLSAPVVGGLWLKKFAPGVLPEAIGAMREQADGYFVFTTFSLWVEPEKRVGPYALQGTPAEYWAALRLANR